MARGDYAYLGPVCRVPLDRTVKYVAVLSVGGRWLRAHIVRNNDRVAAPSSHLMDAVNISRLYTDAARLRALREIRMVPSRRARMIVAGFDQYLRSGFLGT